MSDFYTDTVMALADGLLWDMNSPGKIPSSPTMLAHSLAHLCRYNGHTAWHYSVAQHCVHLADWLEEQGQPPEICFAGLVHDAHEAFVGDRSRVVTNVIARGPDWNDDFRKLAEDVQFELYIALDLDTTYIEEPLIKEADSRICVDEIRALLPHALPLCGKKEALGIAIDHMSIDDARELWLNAFIRLDTRRRQMEIGA